MADAAVESAPGDENDDSWLYGDSTGDHQDGGEKQQQPSDAADGTAEGEEKDQEENENEGNDDHFNDEHFAEVGKDDADQANGDADSQDNGDSDSDDSDDVKVTIGEIKSGPQAYASLNIKRGVGLVASGAAEKPRGGTVIGNKVTMEDLDGPGSINGVPAMEFNIDTIEDKPWNKPGADISDYFNYGFNEVTWSAYCERQRRMRVSEAGVGLPGGPPQRPPPDNRRPQGPPRNDENVQPLMANNYQARENTIQVMTAERREYGRGPLRDPPPGYFPPHDPYYPPQQHPHPHPHPLPHPHAPPYEETWGHPEQTGWTPTDIKELTPGPMGPPPMGPPTMGPPLAAGQPHPQHLPVPPLMMPAPPFVSPYRHHAAQPHERDRERDRSRDRDRDRERDRIREREERDRHRRDEEERERDRDRERSRSIKPDRIREKSYRRDRSRSRSRRHKSRSRSPRPRERSRDRERDRSRDRSRDRERSVKPKNKDKDKDDEK